MANVLGRLYSFLPYFHKECNKITEDEELDGTIEGDRILGEASLKIRKECELISEDEFYRIVDM